MALHVSLRRSFNTRWQVGDADADGIAIAANKLALNGAWVMDRNGNIPISGVLWEFPQTKHAVLPHAAIPDDPVHKVGLTLIGASRIGIFEDGSSPEWVLEEEYWYGLPSSYSVSGTEADVTWTLSGDDGHLFHLTGAGDKLKKLEFISQPDDEDPLDADGNDLYEVTIEATDGVGRATLNVMVWVLDIPLDADEVPVILN